MNLELHPLCTLFPRIAGHDFEALKADIAANGLRQPIVTYQGMILDGGNRYRACSELGARMEFVEFTGTNIVSFVFSANLHRRHLSPGQQAAIVASAQDWAKAEVRGGDRKTDQSATLHFDSVAGRAAESGASLRTQKMADKVARESPDLARQVAHGEISLPKAIEKIGGKAAKPRIEEELEAEEVEAFGPSDEEIDESLREEAAQLEYIKSLLANEDDPLTKALADVKMYRERARTVQILLDGEKNKNNELIRSVKSLQAKLRKVEQGA